MISTTTLSKILNVSSAVILEHYKKNEKQLTKHSRKINHKRYYDAKAVAIMIKSLKLNKYHKSNNLSVANDLRKENQRQSQSIKQLHLLLDQQQHLELNTQQQLKQSQTALEYHKHGWLWRLFH